MRWAAIVWFGFLGCGSGSNPPGALICKSSKEPAAIDVRLAVAKDGLTGARSRADTAKLLDCHFEEGKPTDDRPESLVRGRDRTDDPMAPDIKVAPPPPPPPTIDDDTDDTDTIDDDDQGVAGGVVGGVAGNDPWGVAPPPPPPVPPQNVPPTQLEKNRIAGDKQISPDDDTKKAMERDGKTRVVGSYKLCISAAGIPTQVTSLKSTGYPAYDTKIQTQMRDWRYRPYIYGGDPVPVCTAVTFIYSI